ncbi:hypothetical protein AVEN_147373-1 [Araneus ventricosus]|uniref:Uncharacterized protein n=1 Tax=Araneus ventricosus TaxID=182803 RepID=A0A4Y2NS68_ARAVE|nr:hypothetical protein AVEN_147373-1 [Araneus ventricosus]
MGTGIQCSSVHVTMAKKSNMQSQPATIWLQNLIRTYIMTINCVPNFIQSGSSFVSYSVQNTDLGRSEKTSVRTCLEPPFEGKHHKPLFFEQTG